MTLHGSDQDDKLYGLNASFLECTNLSWASSQNAHTDSANPTQLPRGQHARPCRGLNIRGEIRTYNRGHAFGLELNTLFGVSKNASSIPGHRGQEDQEATAGIPCQLHPILRTTPTRLLANLLRPVQHRPPMNRDPPRLIDLRARPL